MPRLSFNSIEEILDYLFKKAIENPLILVLDEYSYLKDVVKGLDSILQSLIDKYKNTSKLKLIICGSFVDMMKALLIKENPLFGRIDKTIELKPMDYFDSSLFYQNYTNEDKVKLYSVFGGIPYYNSQINTDKSVKENIIDLIASPNARFENEVSMYLKNEIAKTNNANEVFEALAKGYSRFSNILSQSHVSSSPTLVDVLDKLLKMGMIKKVAPINDENNKRKAGYYINDNLSLFFYRYIFPYSSQLQMLDSETFYSRYIEEDFETKYVPKAFEDICRQYLIKENRCGRLETLFDKIGKDYYDDPVNKTNGEFDIVTKDPKGYIFYEAKYKKEAIAQKTINNEITQVKNTGIASYKYGFFSKSGFKEIKQDNLILYTLDDIYKK